MVGIANMFLTYVILVACSVVVIIAAVFCGKKIRQVKDAKNINEVVKEEK